tara:strand:- start:149 stop:469 length:321 start_codon:yes stop_codon:yes gene_type:complete
MKKEKVNKLYLALVDKIENTDNKINENFYEFLKDITHQAHWVSKYSIHTFLFFVDILSLIFFFQLFENLSSKKTQKLLYFLSKIIFLSEIKDMLKKYALIFMYDKN